MAPSGMVLEREITPIAAIAATWDVDWETPSAGAECRPRIGPLAFSYRGRGDPHWLGQSCEPLDDHGAEADTCTIVFACGCHATVPAAALERKS